MKGPLLETPPTRKLNNELAKTNKGKTYTFAEYLSNDK